MKLEIILSLLVLFVLSACDMVRKVDDMHDKTAEMAGTTKEMSNDMKDMKKSTKNVEGTASNTFEAMRRTSVTIRKEAMEVFTNNPSIAHKLSAAATYVRAFEFQSWNGDAFDTAENREELFKDALEQFFEEIQQFFGTEVLPMSNSQKVIYAIAANLHRLDPIQGKGAAKVNDHAVSMLDLIEQGLRAKPAVNSGALHGKAIKESVAIVLQNEKYAVQLIKARQNFLLLLAFSKMIGLREGPLGVLDGLIYENGNKKIYGNLENQNRAEISAYNKFIRSSLRSRRILLELGEDASLEGNLIKLDLREIYSKIQPLAHNSTYNTLSLAQKKTIMDFSNLTQVVLMSDSDFLALDKNIYACKELECD